MWLYCLLFRGVKQFNYSFTYMWLGAGSSYPSVDNHGVVTFWWTSSRTLLGGTTWRYNGISTQNDSTFGHHNRHLRVDDKSWHFVINTGLFCCHNALGLVRTVRLITGPMGFRLHILICSQAWWQQTLQTSLNPLYIISGYRFPATP